MTMIGQTVKLKATGALCTVTRDGIGNDGVRRLRLRALDGGPLLFVEPDDVEVVQSASPTGLASEGQNEDPGQAEGDD